ncbi:MAG: hypothetical protein Q7S69_05375 [Nitrosomonadaceae bacterium]|nr:hypothetical protein [Nitrosomonadaceae bacterium]
MMEPVSYTHSRLCFKADFIEPLDDSESFRVDSKVGAFVMTKSQFYSVFPNVIASLSYREGRKLYHYPKPPAKADQFRVD